MLGIWKWPAHQKNEAWQGFLLRPTAWSLSETNKKNLKCKNLSGPHGKITRIWQKKNRILRLDLPPLRVNCAVSRLTRKGLARHWQVWGTEARKPDRYQLTYESNILLYCWTSWLSLKFRGCWCGPCPYRGDIVERRSRTFTHFQKSEACML